MSDTSASTPTVDVTRTRTFGSGKYLINRWPWAVGGMALGVLLIIMGNSGGQRQGEAIALGLFFIFGSLVFLGVALHRRDMPSKPDLELSSDGILYRLGSKDFRIPWSEVQGLDLIDIRGSKGVMFRDVTVALISDAFFEANIPIKSWWARGPGWGYRFIPRDGMVQVAFHHDVLGVPAEELWQEIETRWRLFGGHDHAPLLAKPRVVPLRGWIGTWTPTILQQQIGAGALVAVVMSAIYFWDYLYARMTYPDLRGDQGAYYLEQSSPPVLYARLPGKGVVALQQSEISKPGTPECRRHIEHDEARSGLTPGFTAFTICALAVNEPSGGTVNAVFKLVAETLTYNDWQDKPVEYRAIVPAKMSLEEADARLCAVGSCAPS